ncbi:MAG: Dihydroneopterin aldolase [Promethearchaeota archaeon]|nr:MAG: Dihydroneopterin aldolase [Candidatus Lokiarchaeota archaeon]
MDNIDKIYFSPGVTKRERACFEAGIKLGALYHILCGIPISSDETVLSSIEKGIEASISCQPYVKKVVIKLNREKVAGEKTHEYDYDEITGKIIRAELILEFFNVRIFAKIDWVTELNYPLMYVEKIIEF